MPAPTCRGFMSVRAVWESAFVPTQMAIQVSPFSGHWEGITKMPTTRTKGGADKEYNRQISMVIDDSVTFIDFLWVVEK